MLIDMLIDPTFRFIADGGWAAINPDCYGLNKYVVGQQRQR